MCGWGVPVLLPALELLRVLRRPAAGLRPLRGLWTRLRCDSGVRGWCMPVSSGVRRLWSRVRRPAGRPRELRGVRERVRGGPGMCGRRVPVSGGLHSLRPGMCGPCHRCVQLRGLWGDLRIGADVRWRWRLRVSVGVRCVRWCLRRYDNRCAPLRRVRFCLRQRSPLLSGDLRERMPVGGNRMRQFLRGSTGQRHALWELRQCVSARAGLRRGRLWLSCGTAGVRRAVRGHSHGPEPLRRLR